MSQFALVLIAGAFGATQALTDSSPAAGEPVWKTEPKAKKAGWEERGALGAADVRAEVHHPPTPVRGSTAAIWVACGVVVGPGYRPPAVEFDETDARRHVSAVSHARGTIAWRYVATNPRYADDARFAVVNCRDGPFGGSKDDQDTSKAGACACKSAAWFAKALWLFPAARFIAKTEDDTLVHDARLVAELRWAWSRESRAEPLVWLGMFEWGTVEPQSGRNGGYCSHGDRLLQKRRPEGWHCRSEHQPPPKRLLPSNRSSVDTATAAAQSYPVYPGRMRYPFASGGIEVRSRALAALVDGCSDSRTFCRRWNQGAHGGCEPYHQECADDDWALACDGMMGYMVALCMHRRARKNITISMLHLPYAAKFHAVARPRKHEVPPEPLVGPMGATTVMHPFKEGAPDALKAQLLTWVWPLGDGLLPIPLVGTYAAPGSVAWELDAPFLARLRQVDPKASGSWDFWVSPRRCKEGFPCAAVPPVDEMALTI